LSRYPDVFVRTAQAWREVDCSLPGVVIHKAASLRHATRASGQQVEKLAKFLTGIFKNNALRVWSKNRQSVEACLRRAMSAFVSRFSTMLSTDTVDES
jgi:hypothetical protein